MPHPSHRYIRFILRELLASFFSLSLILPLGVAWFHRVFCQIPRIRFQTAVKKAKLFNDDDPQICHIHHIFFAPVCQSDAAASGNEFSRLENSVNIPVQYIAQ